MFTDKIDNKFEINQAKKAIEIALKNGVSAARVTLNIGIQNSFSVLDGNLENLQNANDRSLYIQIITNSKYGAYSTNQLDTNNLEKFLKTAIQATNFLAPDKYRSLPPKEICFFGKELDLEQYDKTILELSPEAKKEIPFIVMEELYKKDKKLISATTEYGDMLDYQYILDSQGFEGDNLQSNFTISAECTVKGKKGSKSEGWWYESSMHYADFKYKGCGTTALQRALEKINPQNIKSGSFNMVVENTCASRLVSPIFSALNGSNIQQKNSFLLNKLGEKVFTDKLTIKDNPHLKRMSGSRLFDGEGIATKEMDIISKGRINTYYINTYFSNKMGVAPTIESPSVPYFSREMMGKGIQDLSGREMMKIMGKGIFVTGFNGGNCNGLSGDFSYGIEGFYFENGEILFPINEMNISGNIISLWSNLALIGNDARNCTRWQIPSLAFENVNFTGL